MALHAAHIQRNHLKNFGAVLLGLTGLFGLLIQPASPSLPGISASIMHGLLTTLFLGGIGFFLHRLFRRIDFFSPEELMGVTLLLGTLALALTLVPPLLTYLAFVAPGWLVALLSALQLTGIVLFFGSSTFLFARLSVWKGDQRASLFWRLLLLGLGGNMLFNFDTLAWSGYAKASFLLIAAIPAFALLVQLQWISYLTPKGRRHSFLLLPLLAAISGTLLFMLYRFPLAEAFQLSLTDNHVILLSGGFTFGFSFTASLALLFYLPLSQSFAQQHQALETFGKMSRAAQKRGSEQPILSLLLSESLRHTKAKAGWLSLVNRGGPDDERIVQEGTTEGDIKRIEYTLFCHPDHYGAAEAAQFIYIKDLQADDYMQYHLLDYRSLLCFNIRVEGDQLYRLYLLQVEANGFDQQATTLIASYVTQAVTALSNVYLLQETIAQERVKEDLAIGKQVQQRLLPESFPFAGSIDMAATSVAAEEVGGDYYDYHTIDDNRVAIIMADVSGKGTTAAFHVAEMKGIFQSLVLSETDPAHFVKKANLAVGRCFDKGMFITLVYGVLDTLQGTFTYTRAGHCPVVVYRGHNRSITLLEDDGLGLGILRDDAYDDLVAEQAITVAKGDALVFYTDGVTEARHPTTKEEYGYDRLRDCLLINMDLPAEKITAKIVQDIQQFTAQPVNRDDMSVMVVKC